MIVDKKEFKKLKKSGGINKALIVVNSDLGSGILQLMINGIFLDITFKEKIFIPIESIKNLNINDINLNIIYDGDNKLDITCKKQKDAVKFYNEYCKLNNLNAITMKDIKEAEKERKQKEFERIMASKPVVSSKSKINNNIKNEKVVCCPKCGSTQLTANKKGFSLGKALVGGIALVPIAGVATGMIGKNKIIITCLNCGKQFKPGK